MGKTKSKQTKENKRKFWSPLINLLRSNEFKTREELTLMLNCSDRLVREEVNSVAQHYAVISGSYIKGYRLMRPLDELSQDEMNRELNFLKRTNHEHNSRIKEIKKRQKPLIAAIKVIEKIMKEKGWEYES